MKKLLLGALLFVVCCLACITTNSCSDRKAPVDSLQVDSLPVDSSSEEEKLISETPMPKAADELFDDFIFNFAANRKLQLDRIVFPLPSKSGGKVTMIEKNRWQMEHFFMRQDFYTLIVDNMKQLDAVKDTGINHVVVEKIYLKKNYVKQYLFDRENGEWKMTSINNTSFNGSPNASFLKFYTRFVNDSTFQEESVADELQFTGPDPDDDFGTIDGILLPDQWASFAPPLPSDMIYNVIYGQQGRGSHQKIFVIRGIANGLETMFTFRRTDGKWKLVKLNV